MKAAPEGYLLGTVLGPHRVYDQPCMRNPSMPGWRSQPRDGRGRLLGRAWLVEAERFTDADLAWFRGRS